jgi:hypothetical protein
MIVCWVLFGIGAVTTSIGWGGWWHFDREVSAVLIEAQEAEDQARDAAESGPWEKYRDDLILETPETRELERRKELFVIFGLFGSMLAVGILVWNILCHTAYWVW